MGMIHPDEFFQSPEVMAKYVFGIPYAWIPWEYKLPTPNRSIVWPSLISGLPYELWKQFGFDANGLAFLLLPRILLLATSFAFDAAIVLLSRRHLHVDPSGPLFAFSTSHTTWIFLTRPFSNTSESLVLLGSFVILFQLPATPVRTAVLGVLLALGTFARFTFILFFLPLGLYLVWDNDRHDQLAAAKKADLGSRSFFRRLGGVLLTALIGAAAFLGASAVFILVDTWYFQGSIPSSLSSWVVAPFNNLVYNMDSSHLAEHGLHPRTNHWLVNMPLLFGPAVFCLVGRIGSLPIHWLLFTSVVVPVTFLSLAPHQEARFLLPVGFPLFLLTGSAFLHRRWLQIFWLAFNLTVGIWFGFLQQGGLLPALLSTGGSHQSPLCTLPTSAIDNASAIVLTGTYMPPRFALSPKHNLSVEDIRLDDMARVIEVHHSRNFLVIFPEPLATEINTVWLQFPSAKRTPIQSCWPFISAESFPRDVWNTTQWTLHVELITWKTLGS
ncbi:hypothetical protein LEN26_000676 [Aphanomyces euteiches]|nr:hypothetical protein AeMF1_016624 [Aphanomyces euteiches]KAH9119855.1 hypothetical protein AeMF1_007697 [Aphanomyces euteiches]KAH9122814.1 hypothetical protein AeMF1_006052 [Aphanomyces euteiches]KAH9127782.1 hypothetical protein AeMF1_001952 [Aphanomyces euteiches]KAH9163024.1 hypothetical protein LEN26_000676 [Aphanomyces euteiches]